MGESDVEKFESTGMEHCDIADQVVSVFCDNCKHHPRCEGEWIIDECCEMAIFAEKFFKEVFGDN